ncbi:MAG: lysoplasmalogenase [Rhodanobacter sp.]
MLLVALVALGAMAGKLLATADVHSGWMWLHWSCKPLATALIFALAWQAQLAVSLRYRRWILAGIAGSLLGDVFLMLPQDLFVPGLLAFLLGHLCFLIAFLGDSRFAARPFLMLASLGYGAINLQLLWPSIAMPLRLPVVVYVTVLACMAGQAVVRARVFALRRDALRVSATRAAIGAMVFLLSDSLLAWNRFHAPIPLADMWVLSTYYLALWWIARSVQRADTMEAVGAAT